MVTPTVPGTVLLFLRVHRALAVLRILLLNKHLFKSPRYIIAQLMIQIARRNVFSSLRMPPIYVPFESRFCFSTFRVEPVGVVLAS